MSTSKGLIRPYNFLLVQANRFFDALWIFTCLWAVLHYRGEWLDEYVWLGLIATVLFALFAEFNHLYRSWRVAPLHDELSNIWRSWSSALLIVVLVLYVFSELFQPDKTSILLWLITTPVFLGLTRILVRLALRRSNRSERNFRTAAIIGMNEIGHRVADRILFNRWMGVRLMGYFDERELNHERLTVDGPVPLLGDVEDLLEKAKAGEIDIVYVALPMRAETRIKELIERLGDSMVSVYFVADFAVFDFLHAQWETLSEMPVLRVIDSPFNGFNGFTKRTQDILLASLLLVILALPMLMIAVAIRLTSPGPAMYRLSRRGQDGREIIIYQYRCTIAGNTPGKEQGEAAEPQMTALGEFLRRSSLDKLPQLINVLQGRMSMVGPMLHTGKPNDDDASLIERFVLRYKVRPGITGWAQINELPGDTGPLEKMRSQSEYDLEYINNWSFWFDLRILVLSLVRMWRDRRGMPGDHRQIFRPD